MHQERTLYSSIPHIQTHETAFFDYRQTHAIYGANPQILLFSGCDGKEPHAILALRNAVRRLITDAPTHLPSFALNLMLHPDAVAAGSDTWGEKRRNRLYEQDNLDFVAANLALVGHLRPQVLIGFHEDNRRVAKAEPNAEPEGFYLYEYHRPGERQIVYPDSHPLFGAIQGLGVDLFSGLDDPDPKLNNKIRQGYICFNQNPRDDSYEVRAVYDDLYSPTHAFIVEIPMHAPLIIKEEIAYVTLTHLLLNLPVSD